MAISVAGRILHSNADLPEHTRLIVRLIGEAYEWFEWAVKEPTRQYRFRDEAEMVLAIQSGVHGGPVALLNEAGLLVGPVKLMSMSTSELQLLAKGGAGAELAVLLERHHLASKADFEQIGGFLQALGVDDAPVFQARSLTDLLVLLELQRELGATAPLVVEAARFALANAGNIPEFADYVRFYRDYVETAELGGETPEKTAEAIEAATTALTPMAFFALESLQVEGFLAPGDAHTAIRQWLSTGRQLGFPRASLFIQQFVADGGYNGQLGHDADRLVHEFFGRAQRLLSAGKTRAARLAQDGMSYTFTLTANGDAAEVEVSAAGRVTMVGFGRRPATRRADGTSTPKQLARRGVTARIS